MPTTAELLRVAELVKLAADTVQSCSAFQAEGEMARIADIALRMKATAEELEAVCREMECASARPH